MDRLEQAWNAGRVIRVDILTPAGRAFADQHGFVGTPTFVLFDGAGIERARWQRPPALDELK